MRTVLTGTLTLLLLLASPVRAEPEPAASTVPFPVALRDHLRDVVEDVTHLETRGEKPGSRAWLRTLRRQLDAAEKVVASRPAPLSIPEPLQTAHDAWERARRDTHKVYVDLVKAAKTDDLMAALRVRAHGLALGYRNACREALAAFLTKEALAAYPDVGPVVPGRFQLEAPFAADTARTVCTLAAELTRALHKHEARVDAQRLARMDKHTILVVDGAFDHIAVTLSSLRLPHVKIAPLVLKPQQFKEHKIVLWGCGEPLPPAKMRRLAPALRLFVEQGGSLYTTDWSADQVLQSVAPRHLLTEGRNSRTEEMIVEIVAPRATADHALLRGVFRPEVKTRLWLERAWFALRRGPNAKALEILWTAPAVRETAGKQPMMAVAFPLRKGRVLHVVPMAYQESGNLAGVLASQRLLLNFICSALAGQ
jgi:hypothetical protein